MIIKKRRQEYTKLYKKDLHDPDNHDGVITHLESDILECKVRWALGSITMNESGGGDGIPVELFQNLKNNAVKVLHSICQQIWKTQQWPQDWKRSVFIPIPKKENDRECSNYHTVALISHTSKVMLKILQAELQQCMNCELPGFQAGFRKGRRTRDQLPTSVESSKQESSRKTFTSVLLTMPKPLAVWITINCGNFWKRWEYQTTTTYLPPEKSVSRSGSKVRTRLGITDWFQIRKGVHQGCILSSCLFTLYAEYIMRNAGLKEAQAGIRIARRNINNLSYADDTTLTAESEK